MPYGNASSYYGGYMGPGQPVMQQSPGPAGGMRTGGYMLVPQFQRPKAFTRRRRPKTRRIQGPLDMAGLQEKIQGLETGGYGSQWGQQQAGRSGPPPPQTGGQQWAGTAQFDWQTPEGQQKLMMFGDPAGGWNQWKQQYGGTVDPSGPLGGGQQQGGLGGLGGGMGGGLPGGDPNDPLTAGGRFNQPPMGPVGPGRIRFQQQQQIGGGRTDWSQIPDPSMIAGGYQPGGGRMPQRLPQRPGRRRFF